jgi:ketosteroid isomerase-like protein
MASRRDQNVELAKAAYEAIARADIPWITEHTAEDLLFVQGGRFPTAGRYEGRDAMLGHFMEFMQLVDGQFTIEPHDFLASDHRVAAYLTVRVGHHGEWYEFEEVHLWRIGDDGLVVEMQAIPFDPYGLDEFLGAGVGG